MYLPLNLHSELLHHMIRFRCPKCDKKLGVNESQAGQGGVCPHCKAKFRIPAAAIEEEVRDDSYSVEADDEADTPAAAARKTRRFENEKSLAENDDAERSPRRKRKKKRSSEGSSLLDRLDGFTGTLLVAALITVVCVGLSLIWEEASYVPIVLGCILAGLGGLWFLAVAFQESPVAGLLCLLVPFYSLFYLVTHFEETKRPFFVQLAGLGMVLAASCAGLLPGLRH